MTARSSLHASVRQIMGCWPLVWVMVTKRIRERNVGSLLGIFWTIYNAGMPIFTNVIVFFFIAKVDTARYGTAFEYSIFIFSGMIPWLFICRVINDSADCIVNNLDILKQAIFPVEILTIISVAEILFGMLIQVLALAVIMAIAGRLHATLLLAPLLILALVVFAIGISWILSIACFFLRDLKEVINSLLQLLMFTTPVLYVPEVLPQPLQTILWLNPFTYVIQIFRALTYDGQLPSLYSVAVVMGCSLGAAALGLIAIAAIRRQIGDMV
jgi:lipopolysaccharide transport system permease protein